MSIFVNEPSVEWGGSWTEKKLNAFSKYVEAYLTIMNKNPFWETIYFDGFVGSGERKESCSTSLYKQLELTIEEERVYKGAAERVLTLSNNLLFNYYYFIDSNKESLNKLEIKLNDLQLTKKSKCVFRPEDCNKQLLELSNALKNKDKKLAALVLLDPFGMQIDWKSIESLKDTRSDIWILIPTGVIVNRLLDKSGKLKFTNKLQSFFGLSEDEIRKFFYTVETKNTLFGDQEEIINKISNPIERIAELYSQRLQTIWTHVTEKPLRLLNTKGVPIFHFVFASNNKNAVKIAKQIINTSK